MTQLDVASVGVTFGVSGVEAARAALESMEATGQRVGAAIGKITSTVSVQGADTGARVMDRVTDATNALTRSSGVAAQAVQADSATRVAALSREAAAAEKAAAQAEAAVAKRQAAVEAANAAETAAIRSAGGDPSGVAAAITRASDRAAQALDVAQAKAAQLRAAAASARQEAEEAARSVERVTTAAPASPPSVRPRTGDPMAGAAAITLASVPADQSGRLERLAAAAAAAGQAMQTLGAEAIPARAAVAATAAAADQAAATAIKATVSTDTFLAALKAMGVAATASGNAVTVAGTDMATATGMATRLGAAVTVLERGAAGAAGAASGLAAGLSAEAAAALAAADATDRATAATRRFTVAAPPAPRQSTPDAPTARFTVAAPSMPSARAIQQSGDAAVVAGSKYRSAANGLTALAFAATGTGHSFQGMALGAGLAISSLAELGGAAGAVAGPIGAAVTITAALVGILERLTDKTKEHAELAKAITNREYIKGTEDATTALAQLDAGIANVQANLAKMRAETLQPLTGGYGLQGLLRGPIRAAEDDLKAAYARRKELVDLNRLTLAPAGADAARSTALEAARAVAQVETQAADARAAEARRHYDVGLADLGHYHAARLDAIRGDAAREVAVLREQQAQLRTTTGRSPTESTVERDARLAEARRLDIQIGGIEAKRHAEERAAADERAAQEIALSQRVQAAHADVFTALGLQHETEMAQIREKARLYGIALAQNGKLSANERQRTVDDYRDTLTQQATATQAQREIGRLQADVGAQRTAIQARVARGQITEVEGAREIAAAERAAIPGLTTQLDIVEQIATVLGNKALIASVHQLRAELGGMDAAVSPLQARLNTVFNDLAARGTRTAEAVTAKLKAMAAAAGGVITPKIAFAAEGLANLSESIDRQFAELGLNTAKTFAHALTVGIETGLKAHSLKAGFKAFGESMLEGMGSMFTQLGEALLAYGLIMTVLGKQFANPLTAGPAALIAGAALIALGATFSAIASNQHPAGGSGSSYQFTPPSQDQSASVILTPRAAGKAPQAMNVVNQTFHVMGNSPEVQRFISEVTVRASRRGMPIGATG